MVSMPPNRGIMNPSSAVLWPFFFLVLVNSIWLQTSAAAMPVSFQTIAKGNHSGIDESAQIVIRSQPDWTKFWQKHSAVETNPQAAPAIDLSKEVVVAIFLGKRPSGGYAVEITSVERSDGILTVIFRETTPKPGVITTQAFTHPFHIVRVGVEGTPEVRFRRAP